MIKNKFTGEEVAFSCEVFPPKRNDDIYGIFKTLDEIKVIQPDFISVTYGAGGGNRKNTVAIAAYIQNICEVPALAHMTAVGMDDEKLALLLSDLKLKGVNKVLALRGDKPKTMTEEEFNQREYKYASDFIPKIREVGEFEIAAACYPEKHPESQSSEDDIIHLKEKTDKGVDFLITQMFFDNSKLFSFFFFFEKHGITTPVHAGIMPITSANQLGTSVTLSGSSVPAELSNMIAKYGASPEDMKKAGVEYAVNQIEGLLKEGIHGIHLYSMNKSDVTIDIYNAIV